MNTRQNVLAFGLLAVVLLILSFGARQWVSGQVASLPLALHLDSDYTLTDTYSDDLIVVGENITLAPESRVLGDTSLIGNSITIEGAVEGDLTLVGDTLTLTENSHINSDASLMGSTITLGGLIEGDVRVTGETLNILPGTRISGELISCAETVANTGDVALVACNEAQKFAPFEALVSLRNGTPQLEAAHFSASSSLLVLLLGSLALTGFSTLAVTVFPRQISHIEEAMRTRPRSLVGAGFATFLLIFGLGAALVFVLAVIPAIGLLILPIYALLGIALAILVIAGMVTLSMVLGDWLVRRLMRAVAPPLITAAVGSLVLSSVLSVMALLPFGFLISLTLVGAVSSVGVGASLLTRLGTRPLHRSYFIQG